VDAGILIAVGRLALAGAGLATFSFGREEWADIRYWPRHLAFGLNAILAIGFIAYAGED
jgi:hypothetical protein